LKEKEERLKACLAQHKVGIGELYCFNRVESTMDSAFALNRNIDRTVIVAQEQARGRGRFDRRWYSKRGGLYTSIVLTQYDPGIPYSMLAAYALLRTFHMLGVEASLKWVNDVFCGKARKVAGVLTEERKGMSVIGMGVNVNIKEFPTELEEHATSLLLETGLEVDIIDLLCSVLQTLVPILDRAHGGGIEELLADWEEKSHMRDRKVKLIGEYGELYGIVRGINRKNGALLLSTNDELKEIYEGSLVYLD
jgi:BirA family biotin operon repressor/biotin-[acetyl-CoA-carboxylase] ligase